MVLAFAMRPRARVAAAELELGTDRYPDLARILDYWRARAGDRFAPRRADIDPADIIESLPRVMLVDIEKGPLDFRYRLSGTGICLVHGQELKGLRPRELKPPAYGALVHEHYCQAVERRVPMMHLFVLETSLEARSYARLILPLSENGADVTMLLAVDGKEQNTRALSRHFAKIARYT